MKKTALILAFLLSTTSAYASQCDQFFPNGKEIVVPNTKVLCNTFYATVYDEAHEAAIFSTEIAQPHTNNVERSNDFHPDSRIANSPAPADYTNTGFDRGHLTPAADAADDKEMSDTFLMTNMTPQEPTVNRESWRMLEENVRKESFKTVVTGAVYKYPSKTVGKHKVAVPVSYYKIVYLTNGKIEAYIANNTQDSKVIPTTIDTITSTTGIRFK